MISFINKIIKSISSDKKDHVLAGMIIGYPLQALGLLFNIITEEYYWFIIFSLIAIIIVGSKEIIHDWILGKGNPEWWDFIASAVPIVTIIITYLILT